MRKSFKPKTFTVSLPLQPSSTNASENAAEHWSSLRDWTQSQHKSERHTNCWPSTYSLEMLLTTKRSKNPTVRNAMPSSQNSTSVAKNVAATTRPVSPVV